MPPHPASTTSPNAGRSVIFFGHFSPQTHFMQFHRDVARAMAAQGWTVLWISPTGGIRQNPLEWLRGFPNGRLRREGTVWHFRPWGRPGRLFPSPKPRMRAKDRRQFAQVIQRCRLSSPAVIFYLPEELPLLQGVPHGRVAYWVGDIALTMLDTYPGMRSLTDAADTLLTISPRATADARAAYPDKVTPIFTGVAMDRFADPVIPKELASLAHPIVGYAGSIIADRFDIELFVACAERLPEVSFVLVGLIEPALREELLRRGPRNLRVLGPRPYDAVPGIISAFDVGIVPYLVNDFNSGSNPLKLYEYFAAGLPVVSTPLSAIEEAGDLVRFASDGEGFASAIREALREDDQTLTERRRAYAEAHSTTKIAETISASLTEHSTEVLAERSVVIFGHFSPHTHFLQFNRDLGRALAERGWNVLWVSPPGGVREDPVGWLRSFREGSITREGNLWDFRPWGIPKRPFPPHGARGFAKVRRQLASEVERCGMTSPTLLFWDPNEFPLAAELTSERSVYWAGDTTLRRLDSGEGLREILASMDVLLTISPEATEDARRLHPEKVTRISTGVTIERFDHPVPPFDMAMVPRPIAGFAGSANTTRFDLNLFVACARELPDVSFVVVGPVEAPIATALQREALPNIHLLGERPYEDVPGYIAGFDVGIVPYLLNDFNAGSNPLKVFECFAAGVPVVSTRLTAVQEAGDLVRIAATAQEFAAAIREAIEEDDLEMTAKRRAYAEAHGTERIADILEQALRG